MVAPLSKRFPDIFRLGLHYVILLVYAESVQTVIHVLDETFTTISLIPYAEYLVAIASISQHIFQTCGTTAKQVMFATHWFNVMVDRFVDPQYALVVKVMVHMVLLTYLRDIIHRLYLGLRFLLEAPTFIRGLGRLFRWLVVSYKNEFLATNPFLRDAVPYAAGPLAQDVVVASQADSNRRGPGRVVE